MKNAIIAYLRSPLFFFSASGERGGQRNVDTEYREHEIINRAEFGSHKRIEEFDRRAWHFDFVRIIDSPKEHEDRPEDERNNNFRKSFPEERLRVVALSISKQSCTGNH